MITPTKDLMRAHSCIDKLAYYIPNYDGLVDYTEVRLLYEPEISELDLSTNRLHSFILRQFRTTVALQRQALADIGVTLGVDFKTGHNHPIFLLPNVTLMPLRVRVPKQKHHVGIGYFCFESIAYIEPYGDDHMARIHFKDGTTFDTIQKYRSAKETFQRIETHQDDVKGAFFIYHQPHEKNA